MDTVKLKDAICDIVEDCGFTDIKYKLHESGVHVTKAALKEAFEDWTLLDGGFFMLFPGESTTVKVDEDFMEYLNSTMMKEFSND